MNNPGGAEGEFDRATSASLIDVLGMAARVSPAGLLVVRSASEKSIGNRQVRSSQSVGMLVGAEVGFMTLAFGRSDYVEMAVDFALSLREWHGEPIAIAVDEPAERYIAKRYPGVFDAIVRLPSSLSAGWEYKFALADVSPFPRTVFIDADTIVLGDLGAVLADAERVDFAMIGHYCTAPTNADHNGFSVQELIGEFGLSRYFHNHSGLVAFERENGRRYFAECLAVWRNELLLSKHRESHGLADEVAFGIAAARQGAVTLREPFPMFTTNELHDVRSRRKPLCHLYHPPPHDAMKWLMAGVVARRRNAGVALPSLRHWLQKPARKGLRGLPTGLRAALLNLDIRLHASKAGRQAGESRPVRRIPPPAQSDTIAGAIGRTNRSNLLLHRTRHQQAVSTPHVDMSIEQIANDGLAVPLALGVHCWPSAPVGFAVRIEWNEGGDRAVLKLVLSGALPDHPDAVVCIRFRGCQAGELEATLPLRATVRCDVLSNVRLDAPILAVGAGADYLASVSMQALGQSLVAEIVLPPGQQLAAHDEIFVEFRLPTAALAQSRKGIRIDFLDFHLGQRPGDPSRTS
ncbi:MAG TPA: hypothetical protein VMI56_23320 [Reyranella sp.]|nr:hypothetical protein [Reyranella sp.]